MLRSIAAVCVSAFALLSVSCCCTGEPKAAALRPLPAFKEIEVTTEVEYAK